MRLLVSAVAQTEHQSEASVEPRAGALCAGLRGKCVGDLRAEELELVAVHMIEECRVYQGDLLGLFKIELADRGL